jgi:hypothetical protein
MKNEFLPCFLLTVFLVISCDVNDSENDDPNIIGGETNIAVTQVGNTITASPVKVGNKSVDVVESVQITKNEGGVLTIKIKADLTKDPALAAINSFVPSTYKNAQGKIDTEVKYKMTSEGIQDFYYDNKPFTIAKFGCKVGDKYSISRSDGKTSTRTVVSKSTTDDFPYGFMFIKTIGVEQNANTPGISKYSYHVNHKFGLVNVTIKLEDGSTASMNLYPTNY